MKVNKKPVATGSIEFSMDWQQLTEYIKLVIDSHAKKTWTDSDSEGNTPRKNVYESLEQMARVADLAATLKK